MPGSGPAPRNARESGRGQPPVVARGVRRAGKKRSSSGTSRVRSATQRSRFSSASVNLLGPPRTLFTRGPKTRSASARSSALHDWLASAKKRPAHRGA